LSLAIYWYRKAAAHQHEPLSQEARIYLGDIYAQGDSVPVDLTQANHWYQQASAYYQGLAEQGWAPAQYSLGLMHERGKGVELDREKAAYWYRKAAEDGYEPAKAALATLRMVKMPEPSNPKLTSESEPRYPKLSGKHK